VWNDQGFKMWKLHQDNQKLKEIGGDLEEHDEQWENFVMEHKRVQRQLQDLQGDLDREMEDVV